MQNNQQARRVILADRVVVGFSGKLKGIGRWSDEDLKAAAAIVGRITTPKSRAASGYVQITSPLTTDEGRQAGRLTIDLHATRKGDDLVLSNRCAVELNGLRMTRAVIDPARCGSLGRDGKDNLVGVDHDPDWLRAQHAETLELCFLYFLDGMQAAFGEAWSPERIWLKAAEACEDVAVADANAAARIIQRSMPADMISKQIDWFARQGTTETAAGPTVHFQSVEHGPTVKIYPKRRDLLRYELCARKRAEVRKLTELRADDCAPKSFVALILDFLDQADEPLEAMRAHVDRSITSARPASELAIKLSPLIERASGRQKQKGPFSAAAQQASVDALDALYTTGSYAAQGEHQRTAIRRDLDALCGPEGPLDRHNRLAIYVLRPEYVAAISRL